MARFFVAGLVSCLVINFVSAVPIEPETLVYKAKARNTLNLEPCSWKQSAVTLEGDIYARPMKDQKNTLSVTIRNPSIIVETDKSELNLDTCESSMHLTKGLMEPFAVTMTENGKLESVAVNKNEPALSKNIKLFLGTLMQLDLDQIKGLEHHTERMEPSYAGMCPAVFKLAGHDNDGLVKIQKLVDYGQCKEIAEDWRSNGLTCQEQTCRSTHERNVNWLGSVDATVKNVDGHVVIKELSFEEKISYNPHKHSKVTAMGTSRTEVKLQDIRKCPEVPSFEPSHEMELINRPVYREANEHVCKSHKLNQILTESYSALVCEQPFSNIFEDVIERAALCSHHEIL